MRDGGSGNCSCFSIPNNYSQFLHIHSLNQKQCAPARSQIKRACTAISLGKKAKKDEMGNKVGVKKNMDDLYSLATTLSKIFGQQLGDQIILKSELIEFEKLMMKVGFKIRFKTYAYWVDLLTVIWAKKILNLHPELEKLLFRCAKYRTNMSYLLQILQIVHYDTQAYFHSQITLMLSVMYLLIPITMEGEPDGYDRHQRALEKSSSPLFIDNVGCNKLFGEFLQLLSKER